MSLEVQWLRFCASNAGGMGLIPGQGTEVPHAAECGQKLKKKRKKVWVGYSATEALMV